MLTVGERRDAMKEKPGRPAPYHDIAMLQPIASRLVAAFYSAEQEDRRQAQRNRDDRRAEIGLVLVLMQGHPGAGLIAIDQARIRREAFKARARCRPPGQLTKRCRHCRPWLCGFGIGGVVTIAGAIG